VNKIYYSNKKTICFSKNIPKLHFQCYNCSNLKKNYSPAVKLFQYGLHFIPSRIIRSGSEPGAGHMPRDDVQLRRDDLPGNPVKGGELTKMHAGACSGEKTI